MADKAVTSSRESAGAGQPAGRGTAAPAVGAGTDDGPGLTRRAAWLGMLLVALIAALAPYNDDLSPRNAPFIGNHFPISIVTLLVGLIVVWNPLLHILARFRGAADLLVALAISLLATFLLQWSGALPALLDWTGSHGPPALSALRHGAAYLSANHGTALLVNVALAGALVLLAQGIGWLRRPLRALRTPLTQRELIVVATLMLVGAAVPTSGLMRYLEPMVVSPFWIAQQFPWLPPVANLIPSWLVPTKDPASPIVTNYWLGIDPVLGGHVPLLPFLIPAVLWALLIAGILGSALFLAAIFRKQWVHHERLTFPLATIPLELMAPPEEGRRYNKLWRNPLLWAGMALPALVYLLAGLHHQFPAVPAIDLSYDVQQSFQEPPWTELPAYLASARLYLAVVGICFFIPSEIAFSLWLFMVLEGLARVLFARSAINPAQHETTRSMGIYLAYFGGLLWLARGHLRHVLRSAWRGGPRAEGEPLTYRAMLVGLAACLALAWLWLLAVGMNPLAALLLLGVGIVLFTLMARIVTETGLFYVSPAFWPRDLVAILFGPKVISMLNMYWTQMLSAIFYGDLRETLMPFASNSLRMGQELKDDERPRWFRKLCLALLLSVIVAGAMHHYLSYTRGRTAIEDNWASNVVPEQVLRETYAFSNTAPPTTLSTSWTQFGLGAVMVSALMVGRVLWAGWPFHPIGLVLMGSGPMQQVWFSIFIGWGIKRLLLRYGGALAFRRARPLFIGLILGEMLSAGLWMFVGLLTNGSVRYAFLPS